MAKFFSRADDFQIAEEFAQKALALQRPGSSDSAATMDILGSIYLQQSDYVKAEEHFYRAFRAKLEDYQEKGGFLSDVASSCKALADLYEKQKRFHLALGYYRYAQEIYNQSQVGYSPYALDVSDKVASIERKLAS